MIIFFAGNFEYLGSVKKETELAELCLASFKSYNRLTSFFFLKETNNVIEVISNLKGAPHESQHCKTEGSNQSLDDGDKQ